MRTKAQLRAVFDVTYDALPPAVRSKIGGFWQQNQIPNESADKTGRFLSPLLQRLEQNVEKLRL